MTTWYDLPPSGYAKGLRYNADRCDEQALRMRAEAKPWSESDIDRCERNAKRLRAMAMLCEISTAERAGEIDFFDMHSPRQTTEEEAAAVARAKALYLSTPSAA